MATATTSASSGIENAPIDSVATNLDGSPIPDVVVITGERMSTWDKIVSYIEDGIDFVSNVFDNGYVSVGVQDGVGVAVTYDFQNNDLYVGGTAGRAGVSVVVGLPPDGKSNSDFLPGYGVTSISPAGIGMAGNDSGIGPAIGTPGSSVGYNVNVNNVVNEVAAGLEDQAITVIGQAEYYFESKYGIVNQPY